MMTEDAWNLVRHLAITLLFSGSVLILLGSAARGLKCLIVAAIKELRDDTDQRAMTFEEEDEEGEQ